MTTDEWFDKCRRLANGVKALKPIPAKTAQQVYEFGGVYIFSDKSGKTIYIGESGDIPERLERHFGHLRRDGTPMPIESRSTPHRIAEKNGLGWPWDYLHDKYVQAIEILDPHMREQVERALIQALNPIANPLSFRDRN